MSRRDDECAGPSTFGTPISTSNQGNAHPATDFDLAHSESGAPGHPSAPSESPTTVAGGNPTSEERRPQIERIRGIAHDVWVAVWTTPSSRLLRRRQRSRTIPPSTSVLPASSPAITEEPVSGSTTPPRTRFLRSIRDRFRRGDR